jgi:hypothetical protein
MKDYFLKMLETCAPEDGEAQDAIEHALIEHRVNLSGAFEADKAVITAKMPEILAAYRTFKATEMMQAVIELNPGVPITEITSGM